ncbi:MAG: alpha/beta hydrolase [Cellulomonas sp.]|nr:alpha/beta hydrolase [Cellulomonas sp.]
MTTVDSSALLVDGPWQHRFVTANGARFHVAVAGPDEREAPLVVLLHGLLGYWWSWRHQLPALGAAGYRVAAMDLRGTGGSDKPPRGYDVATLVADVSGVVRSLGADRAVVIGSGTGGDVAWAMPALVPEVVDGVVALAAPRPARPHGEVRPAYRPRSLRHLAYIQLPALPERSLTHGELTGRLLAEWGGVPGWPDAETVAAYRRALQVPFAAHSQLEQLRWLVRSVPRADGARLRGLLDRAPRVPVLQVHGARDGLRPAATASLAPSEAARFTSSYRYELITGAGHFPAEQAPAVVNALILDWLAEL